MVFMYDIVICFQKSLSFSNIFYVISNSFKGCISLKYDKQLDQIALA